MPTLSHKQTPLLVAGASLLLEERVLSKAKRMRWKGKHFLVAGAWPL